MRVREIDDGDEVPDAGTVLGVPVGATEIEARALAERRLDHQRYHVALLAMGLAVPAIEVRAGSVEK